MIMPNYNILMRDNITENFFNMRNGDFDKKIAEKLNEKTEDQISKNYKYKIKQFHSYNYTSELNFNNEISKFTNDKELIDIKYSTCYTHNRQGIISSVLIVYV